MNGPGSVVVGRTCTGGCRRVLVRMGARCQPPITESVLVGASRPGCRGRPAEPPGGGADAGDRRDGEPPDGGDGHRDGPAAGPRLGRRAVLGLAAAGAGAAAVAGATNVWAGHEPVEPTPDRPPPSSTLFSHAETRLAFRNHGMHFELLDRPITPVASHFQLIHFDIPTLAAD